MAAESGVPLERANPAIALAVPALIGAFLVLTSVTQPLQNTELYNGKRLLELALFILLSGLVLVSPGLRFAAARTLDAIRTPVRWALGAFLLLGLISSLRLPHPSYALAEVALFATWAGLMLIVSAAAFRGGNLFGQVAVVLVALLGIGVFMLEVAGFAAFYTVGRQYHYQESLIRFVHPRYYNQVQTWTVPLLALLPVLFPSRARLLTVVASLLLAMQWSLVLMTGARGTLVALVTALLLMAVLMPRARRQWWIQHAAGLVLGAALFAAAALAAPPAGGPVNQHGPLVEQSIGRARADSTGRTLHWHAAVDTIRAKPWLGSGPAHFGCEAEGYLAAHPHNFALQVSSEWGIPAATILGGLIAWLLWRSLVRARQADASGERAAKTVVAMLLASVLAAAIHLQVSGLFIGPASQVTGLLVCGWLLAALCPSLPVVSRPRGGWLLGLGVLAMAATLTVFAVKELEILPARTVYLDDERGPSAPRFWRDGKACHYHWR